MCCQTQTNMNSTMATTNKNTNTVTHKYTHVTLQEKAALNLHFDLTKTWKYSIFVILLHYSNKLRINIPRSLKASTYRTSSCPWKKDQELAWEHTGVCFCTIYLFIRWHISCLFRSRLAKKGIDRFFNHAIIQLFYIFVDPDRFIIQMGIRAEVIFLCISF